MALQISQLFGIVWAFLPAPPPGGTVSVKDLQDPHFRHPGGVGYSLEVYARGGTVTPISSYADADQSAENPWPIVLESDGSGDGVAILYVAQDATLQLLDRDGAPVEGFLCDWVKPALPSELLSVTDRLTDVEGSITSLQAVTAGLLDDVDVIDGRLDTDEGDIDALQSTVSSQGSTISSHTGQLSTLDGRATSLEGRATSLEGRATSVEGRATSVEGRATSLESTTGTHTSQISDLQSADTSLDGRIDALEASSFNPPTASTGKFYEPSTKLLLQWGTLTTGGGGTGTATFAAAYAATPVVMLTTQWSGSEFTAAKLVTINTTGFNAKACTIDGDGVHAETVLTNWIAIGFAP